MTSLYENLSARMVERGLDKRFPGAATVMQRATQAHSEIRAARESVRADKNLSPTGQRTKMMEHLEKAAPALRKHQRMINLARADIDKKRAGLRPKFAKVDPAILIAVAAKIAAMKPAEQAGILLSAEKSVDPIHAQAVLDLPPILSGVSEQVRGMLEKSLIEKTYGAAIASLEEEKEAWSTAEAALRTAQGAVQEAGEFPSQPAFNIWLEKVAPPDAHQLAAEARESEGFTAEALLNAAEGLSHASRMKLHTDLLDQATAHLKGGGE
jgi:hypothetical protein